MESTLLATEITPIGRAYQSNLTARAVSSALSQLSPVSRRVYGARIARYLDWSKGARGDIALDREHVQRYLRYMESYGASAQVRNQALAAIKKLAVEASEHGWIEHERAVQIDSIKSKRATGVRTGRWLSPAQSKALLQAPDRTTIAGKRDACVLALLLGCGLRRAEVCSVEIAQFRTVEVEVNGTKTEKLLLTNLVGKGGRVRTVAVPDWARIAIEEWKKELKLEQEPGAQCHK